MNRFTVARCFLGLLAACAAAALLLFPAAASEAVFPLASRLGMVPPAGMMASTSFAGFEDAQNNVFVRLVTLPGAAFGQLNKTMTNDALKKQGMTVEKRETMTLPSGKAILLIARQEAGTERIRK